MRPTISLAMLLCCTGSFADANTSCRVAEILFGPIQLDKIHYTDGDYETAIVRSATFDNPAKPYGAILGEITADRGGFAVRTTNQAVVGVISPDLLVEGWDDVCSKSSKVEIVPVKSGNYLILNDNRPVGTIAGHFPKNGFGVPSK